MKNLAIIFVLTILACFVVDFVTAHVILVHGTDALGCATNRCVNFNNTKLVLVP